MEHTDWMNAGLDSARARFLMLSPVRPRQGTGRRGGGVGAVADRAAG